MHGRGSCDKVVYQADGTYVAALVPQDLAIKLLPYRVDEGASAYKEVGGWKVDPFSLHRRLWALTYRVGVVTSAKPDGRAKLDMRLDGSNPKPDPDPDLLLWLVWQVEEGEVVDWLALAKGRHTYIAKLQRGEVKALTNAAADMVLSE